MGETVPVQGAASNPIGQRDHASVPLVSGNLAEDGNRADGDGARAVRDLMASLPWASRVGDASLQVISRMRNVS